MKVKKKEKIWNLNCKKEEDRTWFFIMLDISVICVFNLVISL